MEFNSIEEAFEAMDAAEQAANENLKPAQIELRDDVENRRYWVRAVPEWDLVIYGVAWTNAEVQPGADFDAAANRARGYLTGQAYSVDTPHGEHGDTHVAQVLPIDAETFEAAKAADWPTYTGLRDPEYVELTVRLSHAEARMLRD